eukprot:7010646-Alexandrium_andersonii.AAC.1
MRRCAFALVAGTRVHMLRVQGVHGLVLGSCGDELKGLAALRMLLGLLAVRSVMRVRLQSHELIEFTTLYKSSRRGPWPAPL